MQGGWIMSQQVKHKMPEQEASVRRHNFNEVALGYDEETAKAGFTHLVYEGMILAADDFCPAGHAFALNTKYLGFAIHQNGFFARQPWVDLAGPAGRSMKILWHGNLICSNRKAHACHARTPGRSSATKVRGQRSRHPGQSP